MTPARGADQVTPFLLPADIFSGEVFSDIAPFVKHDMQGIFFGQWFGEAVFTGLVFFFAQLGLEGTEQLVPDDQEHAHVLVEIFGVGGVMDPVMGGCYQDIFQPAHFAYQLRMYKDAPDLCSGIHENDIQGFESQERQGDKIHEAVEGLKDGGPEADRKIHMFGGMVRYMNGPEESYLMIPPVQPVIQEVFGEQKEEPVGEYIGDGDPVMPVGKVQHQEIDTPEQEVDPAVQQHEINVGQCVFPGINPAGSLIRVIMGVVVAVMPGAVITQQDLKPDNDKVQGSAYKKEYLFSEVFHDLKIIRNDGSL